MFENINNWDMMLLIGSSVAFAMIGFGLAYDKYLNSKKHQATIQED